MVERTPGWTVATHAVLGLGLLTVAFPLYVALVASTHTAQELLGHVPLWFGDRLVENYAQALRAGGRGAGSAPVLRMLLNSLVMALAVAVGKIAISIVSAYAIVYFRFPFRMACFWTIFLTLMLPVEVRIMPTFKVVADLGLLNSYAGLTIPADRVGDRHVPVPPVLPDRPGGARRRRPGSTGRGLSGSSGPSWRPSPRRTSPRSS